MTDLAALHQQGRLEPEAIRARLDRQTVIDDDTGCWLWMGARTEAGYGEITILGLRGRRVHYVHRLAYELDQGPLTADVIVRHSCDNPPCRNPAHLLAGTDADNARDMMSRGRGRGQFERQVVCGRGHPLPESRRRRDGCQICRTAGQRARREAAAIALGVTGRADGASEAQRAASRATGLRGVVTEKTANPGLPGPGS